MGPRFWRSVGVRLHGAQPQSGASCPGVAQPELLQAGLSFLDKPLCVGTMFESCDDVIRVPDDDHVARGVMLSPVPDPNRKLHETHSLHVPILHEPTSLIMPEKGQFGYQSEQT